MRESIRQKGEKSSQPRLAIDLNVSLADTNSDLSYDVRVVDKAERAIRVLEVEAEMNEAQAKRFAELASYVNAIEYKLQLEGLSCDALKKAGEIRDQIRRIRDNQGTDLAPS